MFVLPLMICLQVLLLDCLPEYSATDHDYPQYRMQAHDMQQLPLSCPRLQQLDLRGRIHGEVTGTDLQPLLQLAGTLTSLSLGGGEYNSRNPHDAWVVDDGVLTVVGQLSRLASLTVDNAEGVTDVGLLSLCKLKQLQQLKVMQLTLEEGAVSDAVAQGRRVLKLVTKVCMVKCLHTAVITAQ
jgi:hypothetical protein